MTMNRRTFSTTLLTVAAAPLISARDMAVNATPEKARNVVLVHRSSPTAPLGPKWFRACRRQD